MNFRRMIFWLTILLVFIMAARVSLDTDTWWHLRAGEWIVENRQLPTNDPFSFTRQNVVWKYPGWLIEVPMFWVYDRFGPGGLNIWVALMIAITFGFSYQAASGSPLLRAFVTILAAISSSVYWSARPHLITLLFTSITVFIFELENRRHDKKSGLLMMLGLPLMMLAWVNSHGGFIIGFILWGVYFAGYIIEVLKRKKIDKPERDEKNPVSGVDNRDITRRVVRYSIAGIGMLGLGLLNPLGFRIYLYPFQTVAIKSLQNYIQEWQSPNFHWSSTQPFLGLLILLIAALGFSKKKLDFKDFILISVFLYLALTAARNLALFAVIAPVILTRYLSEFLIFRTTFGNLNFANEPTRQFSLRTQQWINWIIITIVLMGAGYKAYMVYPLSINEEAFQKTLPVNAVTHLKNITDEGNMFNSYNWGGYLLWALPERKVFIDGRTDLYNDEVIQEWLNVVQVKSDWEQVLKKWDIQFILMERDWLGSEILLHYHWCREYQDQLAILLRRCQ